MVFTILYYKNLEPLLELDDYISAIWNNKYFAAGNFEIICRTTNERILKLVRNNFITLNGTDEIAVIETVEFSKDEEQGAIMKITGKFAQSLLNKRVIWNKTLLNGTVESELQRLINENALNPEDKERQLDAESEKETLTGRILTVPETAIEINDLEIISDTDYINEGMPITYIDYKDGTIKETGLMQDVEIATTEAVISETKKDATIKTLEYRKNGSIKKLYSLNTDMVANSSLKNGTLTTLVKNTNIYNFLTSVYGIPNNPNIIVEINNKLKNNLAWSWYNAGENNKSKCWLKFEIRAKIDAPEQLPMSNNINCLTKAQYNAGKCGVACFDNYIWLRIVWANSDDVYYAISSFEYSKSLPYVYIYETAIVAISASKEGVFKYNGSDEELIIKTNTLITENLSLYNAETGAFDNLSTKDVATFELKQVNEKLQHYLNAVVTLKGLTPFNYLKLGRTEGITDQIILQLIGDNLQEKVEEILQLYNLGMRARYEKAERKIYFDFYKGYNRTKGTLQPIIYSESLDNLESYNVVSSNAAANVALVYSENNGEPVSGTAGIEAGALRRETYINKNNDVGYIGADYVKQLQEEGNLTLQSFTLAISADIDNRAYKYRERFYIGDVATIIIKDLNVAYNVRILEAREYNDINGYTIELVLGE